MRESVSIVALNFRPLLLRCYGELLIAGHYSGCHQLPERSFHWGVRKFPVCARCTGIVLGVPLGLLVAALYPRAPLWLYGILLLPLILDGTTQLLTRYRSTNSRRLASGMMFGVGVSTGLLIMFTQAC